MYDRAARFPNNESSIIDVGPGSYGNIDGLHPIKVDSYAPFCSLAPRDSFLTIKKDNNVIPGPGTYDPKIYDHIKGASTLVNRSRRFAEKANDIPGPGYYEVSNVDDLKRHQRNSDAIKKIPMIIHRKSAPPSIPSPRQAFGYEEGRNGMLQKQKSPSADSTIGPAFYSVKDEETAATQKYKGIFFGKKTSTREVPINNEDVPGPGTYSPHHQADSSGKLNSIIGEQMKPVDAKLPRYHELITMIEAKKAVPGPGKYEVKSQFSQTQQIFDANLRPSFGSQEKRFTGLKAKEETPAPISYNDKRHALEVCDRICGLKKTPFAQTSRRFPNSHHVNRTPAPDSYNLPGLGEDVQRKTLLSGNLKGAFGSNSERKFLFENKDHEILPGPSHYSVQSAPADLNRKKHHAVFKSSTPRLQNAADNIPPPGAYDIQKSDSVSRGNPRKVPGKPIDGGFLSSTKRFSQPRDIIVKKINNANPGPGNYEIKQSPIPGLSIVSRVDRFKEKQSDVPGPGTYQLSPLLQNTLLKGTFNITLNNPVEFVLDDIVDNGSRLSFAVTG